MSFVCLLLFSAKSDLLVLDSFEEGSSNTCVRHVDPFITSLILTVSSCLFNINGLALLISSDQKQTFKNKSPVKKVMHDASKEKSSVTEYRLGSLSANVAMLTEKKQFQLRLNYMLDV